MSGIHNQLQGAVPQYAVARPRGGRNDSRAQNDGRDKRDFITLEHIGGHARAVAHVIAHVVGNRGGVARIVFRNARFHFADQVRAHVSGFGEDAAAHAHEECGQRAAEAEANQDQHGFLTEDQKHQARADQPQADRHHTRYCARPKRGFQCAFERSARLIGGALIGNRRHAHAHVPGHVRRHDAQNEKHRYARSLGCAVPKRRLAPIQKEQQNGDYNDERQHGFYLLSQVSQRAITDGLADFLHLLRSCTQAFHLPIPHRAHDQRDYARNQGEPDKSELRTGEGGKRHGFRSVRRTRRRQQPYSQNQREAPRPALSLPGPPKPDTACSHKNSVPPCISHVLAELYANRND